MGLRSGSVWLETTTYSGYLSGRHYILMGLRLFKIGVAGLNPASSRGNHKCLGHLTCLILPVGLCEILPLRKPFPSVIVVTATKTLYNVLASHLCKEDLWLKVRC